MPCPGVLCFWLCNSLEDVDLKGQTWRIPETKNGTPQNVPLVGPVRTAMEKAAEAMLEAGNNGKK